MSPISKSLLLLSIIRRHASTGTPPKSAHNTLRSASKPKTPSHANPPRTSGPPVRNAKSESQGYTLKEEQQAQHRFLYNLLYQPQYRHWRRIVLISPALLLASLHMPYEFMTTNGQSMSPFLNPNSSDGIPTSDRILVQRWNSTPTENDRSDISSGSREDGDTGFQRGQIVVFATPHKPDRVAVKRIVALPGDVVQPLPGYAGGDGSVVVPWNHFWVEGDAGTRKDSMDSNWYGPISQNLVMGEVKAVLTSLWQWNWLDWRQHTWPARQRGRVEENAIMEAAVDPDAVNYSSGWRNGSIALILEQMRKQPERVLHAFVNDPKIRQETRRLYNNALYVREIASSEQEKRLAVDLMEEMEDVYGREALIFGIRMKRQLRDRGELPNAGNSDPGEDQSRDQTATDAERWLKRQGWDLERNTNGTVKTQSPPH